jgi:hypothetical protein
MAISAPLRWPDQCHELAIGDARLMRPSTAVAPKDFAMHRSSTAATIRSRLRGQVASRGG